MASQSASISIGVLLANTSKKSGSASCQIIAGALQQPQPYSGGSGVIQSANANVKLQVPHVSVQIGITDDGKPVRMSPEWYRFLSQMFDQRLGGPQGASVTDLSTTVVDTRAQAIAAQTSVASVSQQVVANAQALGAVVQVAQTNSLAGASQIPPVVYTPNKTQVPR